MCNTYNVQIFFSICIAGEDYEAVAPTTLMFEMSMASDLLVGLDITILNDTVVENRECFYAVINSSDTSVIVDPAMARVCIDDDDSTSQLPIILHGQCVLMASILHASNYAYNSGTYLS